MEDFVGNSDRDFDGLKIFCNFSALFFLFLNHIKKSESKTYSFKLYLIIHKTYFFSPKIFVQYTMCPSY